MRAGDIVRKGTLELEVGVVDGRFFMPNGWPPSMELTEEFELVTAASDKEELEMLAGWANRDGTDLRAIMARRQLMARGLGPSLLGDEPPSDVVRSPAHYHLPDGRQAWEVIEAELGLRAAIDYHRGAELKYQLRAGRKAGATEAQDLAKAAAHRSRILDLQIAVRDGTAAPRPPMPREAR